MSRTWVERFSLGGHLKAIIRDGGSLLAGKVFASAFGFVTIAIITRSLGADGLGQLILSQTIVRLVASLILPKPWQALVRYGAKYQARSHNGRLTALFLIALLVEVVAAIVAYSAVRLGLLFWQEVADPEPVLFQGVLVYATTLLFEITGISTGSYRLFRRFKLQASLISVNALLLFSLVVIGFLWQVGLMGFIWITAIARIAGSMINLAGAIRVLISEGVLRVNLGNLERPKELPEMVSFSISLHFTDVVGTAMSELDYLVLGAYLGPSSVGIMKMIKQLGRPFTLMTEAVKQVIYPEACELYSRKSPSAMMSYILKASGLLAAISTPILLALILLMPTIVQLAYGPENVSISGLAILYVVVHVGFLLVQGLMISALAMGRAKGVFYAYLMMNFAYLLLTLLLAPIMEIAGVILAFAIGAVAWTLWLLAVNRRSLKDSGLNVNAIGRMRQASPEQSRRPYRSDAR